MSITQELIARGIDVEIRSSEGYVLSLGPAQIKTDNNYSFTYQIDKYQKLTVILDAEIIEQILRFYLYLHHVLEDNNMFYYRDQYLQRTKDVTVKYSHGYLAINFDNCTLNIIHLQYSYEDLRLDTQSNLFKEYVPHIDKIANK